MNVPVLTGQMLRRHLAKELLNILKALYFFFLIAHHA